MRYRWVIAALLCMAAAGCKEQRDDAQQAVSAAKALMDLAANGKKAEAASEAAEKAARAQIAPGTDPQAAEQQVQLAKSLAAMKALGAGGPAVNWRQLVPFLPEKLDAFAAKGELEGSTQKAGGFEFSEVSRSYEADKRRLHVKITDATTTPFLRAPFAMAAMIDEDSSSGYKKGKTLAGNSAVVEWREASKESSVVMLVAQRYVVDVRVSDATKPDEAEALIQQLKLDELSKLTAAAAPTAPTAPAKP